MMPSQVLLSAETSEVLRAAAESSTHSLWLGALSFEERCVGSLVQLSRENIKISQGIIVSYQTQVRPTEEAERRRKANWAVIKAEAGRVFANPIQELQLPAYGFPQFQELVEGSVSRSGADLIIIDITCITKIHALALAASLAKTSNAASWMLGYTAPENYSTMAVAPGRTPGWRDIIIAPLSETALLFNESSSRGILLPGHEADRLIVALAEIEPAGGLIAIADSKGRPDLRLVTERRNQKVISQLMRMRASNRSKHVVRITGLKEMGQLARHEIQKAKDRSAPVILFPYGPKPLIFVSALQLSLSYAEASWFVYPIPSSYDVAYSEGVHETSWLIPASVA